MAGFCDSLHTILSVVLQFSLTFYLFSVAKSTGIFQSVLIRLLFTPCPATRCAMHRIYANRINSRDMSRVFCDLRSQKTPRGTLPVNSNELFHITVHPDVHFFQGMGNILIPERSSGQISIQPSHLSFIKLCVRRIFLLDRPA